MKLKIIFIFLFILSIYYSTYAQCGCTNCPVDLPDDLNTTFTASINVQNTSNNTLGVNNNLEQVCINISHDWIGDLDITLIAPDGTEVVLFADGNSDSSLGGSESSPFGSSSDDMVICFVMPSLNPPNVFGTTGNGNCNNQNYYDPCNGTTPCFTGNWGTWNEGCDGGNGLDEFNNGVGTVSGVWTIQINDNAGANQGILNDVTLVFTNPPDNCESACPSDAGTTSNNLSTNNVFLCADATLNVTSDDNYILPNPAGADPVGLAYAIYNCAPTTSEPTTDPCFTGWYIIDEDFTETNTIGNTYYDYIINNPSPDENANGSPTGNDLYFVPITFDDYCDDPLQLCDSNLGYDVDNDDCFDMGTPIHVTYVPDMTYTITQTCNPATGNGTVTFTLNGGYPSTGGGNFTITDSGDGTLSTTTVANGGSFTINGLTDDDVYSVTISDAHCSYGIISDDFSCGDDPCLVDAVLTATPPATNFPNDQYPPGTTVEFCIDINQYNQTNVNFLHGIIPSFGSAWDITSLTPTNDPNVAANNESGSTWNWFPGNTVDYNSTSTLIPDAGWWFLSTNSPGGLPTDPNASWGDGCTAIVYPTTSAICNSTIYGEYLPGLGCHGDPLFGNLWVGPNTNADIIDASMNQTVCESLNATWYDPPGGGPSGAPVCVFPTGTCYGNATDGMGLNWEACFEITTVNNTICTPNQDASVEVKTYADGETGIWTDIGCTPDQAVEIDATLCCLPPPNAPSPQTFCEGTTIGITASGTGTGNLNWFTSSTGGLSIGTGSPFNPGVLVPNTYTYYVEENDGGCTSTTRTAVTVVINPLPTIVVDLGDQEICLGEVPVSLQTTITNATSILWDDLAASTSADINVSPSTTTVYVVTATNACGNRLANMAVTVWENDTTNIDTTLCDGETININGTIYGNGNNSGFETLTSTITGCDSILQISVNELPLITGTLDSTICFGASFVFNGTTYSGANPSGTETFTAANGCDSVVTVTVTESPLITGTLDSTICFGASFVFNGTTYSGANPSGTETFTAANGCDSVVTVTVTESPLITGTLDSTICFGASFDFNGTTYSGANPSGTETLTAANGCDSVVTVTVTESPLITGTLDSTICFGASFVFNGTTYSGANPSGTETFTAANGCDSVVTVTVTESPLITGTLDSTICFGASFDFNGTTYSGANPSGTETLTTANGCDSVVTVTVTELPIIENEETFISCDSININGSWYFTSTTESILFTSSTGCDSTYTANIEIYNTTNTTNTPIIACDSAIYNGVTYFSDTVVYDTIPANLGVPCNSLFISEVLEGSVDDKCIEIFNGTGNTINLNTYSIQFFFNGNPSAGTTINLSGSITDGATYLLCDDGATSSLTSIANQTSTSNFYSGDDAILLLNGSDTVDIFGNIGCDPGSEWTGVGNGTLNNSVFHLPGYGSGITSDLANVPCTFPGFNTGNWGSTNSTTNFSTLGNHTSYCNTSSNFTLYCDSIFVQEIVINYSDSTFSSATSCLPADTGFATTSHLNVNGCDSTHTIYTALLASDSTFSSATSCLPADTGFATTSHLNVNGCDSTHTIYTALLASDSTFSSATSCLPADTGFATTSHLNVNGCDSTHTIYTALLASDSTFSSATSCLPADTGFATTSHLNVNGCDSTHTIYTALLASDSTFSSATSCLPADTGFATTSHLNVNGCDSTHTIYTALLASDSTFSSATSCLPADTGFATTLHLNVNGCDSTHTIYTALLASDSTFSSATSCLPADTGFATTSHLNVNGCDSTHTIYTALLASDSTFSSATSCLPADTGFATTSHLNVNGCDSTHTIYTALLASDSTFSTSTSCLPADTGFATTLHLNVNGCDSTHTIYTALLASDSTYSTATSCLPADTGFATTSHLNVNGCDSTHTIYTALLASDSTFSTSTSCNPTDTGVVTSTFTNQFGCDSLHTIITTLDNNYALITQPQNISVCNIDTGLFYIETLNADTYQWQFNATGTWINVTDNGVFLGANNDSLFIINPTSFYDGYLIRVLIDACGILDTSNIVSLDVILAPNFGATPPSATTCENIGVSFGIFGVQGDSLNYQWQYNDDNTGFVDIFDNATFTGTNTQTLNINNTPESFDEDSFRVYVWNQCDTLFSDNILLIVNLRADVILQPSDTNICLGNNAAFTFEANNVTTYQWQINTGSGFTNLTDNAIFSGSNTDSLFITNPTLSLDGAIFRVRYTDECNITLSSSFGILHIHEADSTFSSATSCLPADTGFATTSHLNEFGCDSTHTIYTALLASDSTFSSATSCLPADTGFATTSHLNVNGCDSTHTIYTALLASDSTFSSATSCLPADTGFATTSHLNVNGCDSTHTIYTALLASDSTFSSATSCLPADTGFATTSHLNVNGCDSTHTIYTALLASDSTFSSATSCLPADTGFATTSHLNVNGCDSTHTIYTALLASDSTFSTANSCLPADTGFATTSHLNVNGCDSTHTIYTALLTSDSTFSTATSCLPADTGFATTSHLNVNGCDSTHTIYTALLASDSTFSTATSCLPADTGFATTSHLNVNGCDSTHTIYTALLASDSTFSSATSCLPADTGFATSSHLNVNGCDSTHTIYTALLASDSTFSSATSCLPADTGFATTSHLNVNGCDSTHTIYTALLASDSTFSSATSCLPADTGFATTSHLNVNGCDSTHTIYTALLTSDSTFSTATSCLPADTGFATTSHLNVNGCDSTHTIYTALLTSDSTFSTATSCLPADTGFATTSHLNVNGCDSTHTIYTVLLASPITQIDTSGCDSITINGTNFTSSQLYFDTLIGQANNGCDSIVQYNITINNSSLNPPSSTAFNTGSDGLGSTLPGGSQDLLWAISTTTLNGAYNPAIVMTTTPAVYYTSPWPDATWISLNNDGSHSVNQSFFYRADFELPCEDCIINNFCLNLDIFSDNTITEVYINGIPQSPYGTFIPNSGGFDSTNILSLSFCNDWMAGNNSIIFEVFSTPGYTGFLAQSSINPPPPPNQDSIFQTICANDSFYFDNVYLNTTGYYIDTLQDIYGCDSIIILELTVNELDTTYENLTSCNPSDTGVVSTMFNNQYGCDSLHITTTTLIQTAYHTENITACDSTNLLSNWYYADTTFIDTIMGGSINGCDSLVTYNVTINNTTYTYDTINACDSININGTWYFQEDTLISVNSGANNCDSIHTTILNITNAPLSFSEMNLDGNAYQIDGNTFSLTENQGNDYGSIWFTNAIDLTQDFNLNFELFFGCDDAGADGLAFVLQQNNTNIGVSGGGMGYGGIIPSLGVEFDTYENTSSSDLIEDHIAILQDGNTDHANINNLAGPVQASSSFTNIEDCAYHDIRITWNATTQTFEVYFDGSLRITYNGDIVNDIFGGNPTVYWGVTAATGGAFNAHRVRVKKLDYISLEDDTICNGDTINISAPLSGVTYNWSPTSSLDNSSAQNPNFFPSSTTQYILELINSEGCSSFDTMVIFVHPTDSTFSTATSCLPADTGFATTSHLNVFGCDSTHTIYTALLASDSTFSTATSCLPADTGFATTSHLNVNGCDSTHTIYTALLASDSTFSSATSCLPADTGFATTSHLNVNGCDSTHTIYTSLLASDSTFSTANSCLPADTGFATTSHLNVNGCDSTHTIYTSLLASDSTFSTATSCLPADTGFATTSHLNVNGCDSTHTIYTALLASDSTFSSATSCLPADTGFATTSHLNVNGCDSTHTIYTSLLASDSTFSTANSCLPADTGFATTSHLNVNGCDSTHTIYTALLASDSTFSSATSCLPADTGFATTSHLNVFGCDSTHTIYTALLASDSTFSTANSCLPADTGFTTTSHLNVNGCDSTHTIYTALLASDSTFSTATSCLPADTGFATTSHLNVNGCDSTHTIYTALLASDSTFSSTTSCNPADTGMVSINLLNQFGCDSVHTITTTLIGLPSDSSLAFSLCPYDLPYILADGSAISSGVTNYEVVIPNSTGCDSTITYTITISPEVTMNPDYVLGFYGDSIEFILNNGQNTTVSYIGTDGVSCTNCSNFYVVPTENNTTYYFTFVDDSTGCIFNDTLRVDLEFYSELNVPNIFTPNGDGQNDIYRCYGKDIVQYQLEIFDRWGGRMFITTDLEEGWNGIFNSLPVESGVYIALIRASGRDGQQYQITKNIKLVR